MSNLLESSKRKNTLYLIREWQRKFGTRFNEVFCGPRAGAALGQSKQHRPTIVGRRFNKNKKVCPLVPSPFPYIVEALFSNAEGTSAIQA